MQPVIKTLEDLRREKHQDSTAIATGYFNHLFKVKQPKSAAQLEALISEYTRLMGGICTKVTTAGRQITDKVDKGYYTVTNSTYIPSTTRKGTSDLIIGYQGQVIYVEVKFSKGDRLSQHQKDFKRDVEEAGCPYWVVKTLSDYEVLFSKFVSHANRDNTQEDA